MPDLHRGSPPWKPVQPPELPTNQDAPIGFIPIERCPHPLPRETCNCPPFPHSHQMIPCQTFLHSWVSHLVMTQLIGHVFLADVASYLAKTVQREIAPQCLRALVSDQMLQSAFERVRKSAVFRGINRFWLAGHVSGIATALHWGKPKGGDLGFLCGIWWLNWLPRGRAPVESRLHRAPPQVSAVRCDPLNPSLPPVVPIGR